MKLKNQKTGLFFGSFNPIHQGHMMLANYLVEFTDLRSIWFIISPHNPFKKKDSLLDDHHRHQLVQEAIGDDPRFYASTIEFDMPKPSFTIDTLTHLSERYPDKEFVLLCGADILPTFHKWKNYEQILSEYKMLVYNRPGFIENPCREHQAVEITEAPQFDISSSFIRKAIAEGKDVRYFLPGNVYHYIREMHFYE
ncbi:MAG TPA: nicotinate (nicotinamide) nucleotide adenylyltransferase [Bacteroidales bacterium]|nr:nicotinate (nicotinamide) nucleotide adenylyltransferase [Bacteroidales bacterium]